MRGLGKGGQGGGFWLSVLFFTENTSDLPADILTYHGIIRTFGLMRAVSSSHVLDPQVNRERFRSGQFGSIDFRRN
jgi:hypothetical protein